MKQNVKWLGCNMFNVYTFALSYPGWHTWDKRDRGTRDAVKRLAKRGLIKTNEFGQFKLAEEITK